MQRFPDDFVDTLRPVPVAEADGARGADLRVDRARFPSFFAQDIPRRQTRPAPMAKQGRRSAPGAGAPPRAPCAT